MADARYKKLLEELPKNNFKVAPSARKAGFSPQYADKAPKRILANALKVKAQELTETANNSANIPSKDIKRSLAETIGLTREDVSDALKKIALNDRDYASAIKILAVIARNDLDFNLNPEETKTIVPILNIGVRENGLVEPHKESISEYIPIDSDANSPSS